MKFLSLIIILFLLFGGLLSAQEVLTFQDAISMAMESNHQIKVAKNTAEIARNNVNIGNANLLPKIDLVSSANYQDTELPASSVGAGDDMTTTTASAQASYTLFDGFGNVYRFQKLKRAGEAGELFSRNQIEYTLYSVSGAYYNTALAYESWQIARDLLDISRQRLQRAKQKAVYGQANTIEVLSAQVDLNADSVDALRAKLILNETRRDLNVLLNRHVEDEYGVESVVNFIPDMNFEELKQRAMNNNASYLLQVNQLKQSRLDLKITRSASFPRIDLTTSYGYSRSIDNLNISLDDPTRTLRAGASVSFNLFNGFKTSIQRQNANISYENQKLYEAEARLELEKEIANAYESYQNSRLVLELESKNVKAAELNFQRTQELYNLGQVTTTQFREAQLNLFRAKYSISTAKYTAKLKEIDLLRISGNLLENQ